MAFDFPDPPATGPIRWDASLGVWLVTQRDDVDRILRSDKVRVAPAGEHVRRLGARTGGFPALAGLLTDMAIFQNAPEHAASRAWLKPILQDMAARWTAETLDQTVRELLDGIDAPAELDAAASLAGALPHRITAETLDLEPEALAEACDVQQRILDSWWWAMPLRDYPELDAEAEVFRRLLGDHPLTADIDSPGAAWATLSTLLTGALTSAGLIGNAIHVLARRPDLQDRLRAAPREVDAFVEECLRFCGPVKRVAPRRAENAVALGGGEVEEGGIMVLRLDSSSRDSAAYDDPGRFDMDRSGPQPLAFAAGPHLCPGAFLGRLEARAMVRGLLTRFRILPGAAPARIADSRHFLRFEALPIRLETA
jgi:cytochrome P450